MKYVDEFRDPRLFTWAFDEIRSRLVHCAGVADVERIGRGAARETGGEGFEQVLAPCREADLRGV